MFCKKLFHQKSEKSLGKKICKNNFTSKNKKNKKKCRYLGSSLLPERWSWP
jgi:hypothetical protein